MTRRLRIAAGFIAIFALLVFTIACDSNRGRLHEYCSYKFTEGSYLYQECMDDGWKDWYANAHWMQK